MWAAHYGQTEFVQMLLDANANVDIQDDNGWTALHGAADNSKVAAIEALIKACANVNIKANDGYTALEWVQRYNRQEAVAAIEHSIRFTDTQKRSTDLLTKLYTRVKGGYVTRSDLQQYVDLNNETSLEDTLTDHKTLLYCACSQNQASVARLLLAMGANPNASASDLKTPLIIATLHKYLGCVYALLEAKADVNIQDDGNDTASHWAVDKGHIECLRALIAHGANVNIKGSEGFTVLQRAYHEQELDPWLDNNECIKLLNDAEEMDKLVRLEQSDIHIALFRAATTGTVTEMNSILNHLPDVNWKNSDEYGCTALHKAAFRGDMKIIQTLLDAKAQVRLSNNYGETALDFAKASILHEGSDKETILSRMREALRESAVLETQKGGVTSNMKQSETGRVDSQGNTTETIPRDKDESGGLFSTSDSDGFIMVNDVNALEWTCSSCTLVNDPSANICALCEHAKPSSAFVVSETHVATLQGLNMGYSQQSIENALRRANNDVNIAMEFLQTDDHENDDDDDLPLPASDEKSNDSLANDSMIIIDTIITKKKSS